MRQIACDAEGCGVSAWWPDEQTAEPKRRLPPPVGWAVLSVTLPPAPLPDAIMRLPAEALEFVQPMLQMAAAATGVGALPVQVVLRHLCPKHVLALPFARDVGEVAEEEADGEGAEAGEDEARAL